MIKQYNHHQYLNKNSVILEILNNKLINHTYNNNLNNKNNNINNNNNI